jgi:hypothetical protein
MVDLFACLSDVSPFTHIGVCCWWHGMFSWMTMVALSQQRPYTRPTMALVPLLLLLSFGVLYVVAGADYYQVGGVSTVTRHLYLSLSHCCIILLMQSSYLCIDIGRE